MVPDPWWQLERHSGIMGLKNNVWQGSGVPGVPDSIVVLCLGLGRALTLP